MMERINLCGCPLNLAGMFLPWSHSLCHRPWAAFACLFCWAMESSFVMDNLLRRFYKYMHTIDGPSGKSFECVIEWLVVVTGGECCVHNWQVYLPKVYFLCNNSAIEKRKHDFASSVKWQLSKRHVQRQQPHVHNSTSWKPWVQTKQHCISSYSMCFYRVIFPLKIELGVCALTIVLLVVSAANVRLFDSGYLDNMSPLEHSKHTIPVQLILTSVSPCARGLTNAL